ncbi:hypothetical protein CG740_37980 [Streptomyces sp. CB01201]|uniref:hypothetical protein n=1 Tax=Streptomyces sp. CB01201 TaxID=2020324 RepID=UPI000C26F614|nr:hypothetical protein [Streptomyces sp. CB01201]PJM97969.1 hypothetical protein CG740_37980 [Streptomyces sp. CB01201]
MSVPIATIDAEAFPLHVVGGPHLMVMVPVARDAVDGLDEAYTEASLDCTGIQSTGTTIDARWNVTPDHQHVLLRLYGQAPQRFELTVRFELKTARQRQGFLDMAVFADTGRVSLWIYPDKEDAARAAVAVQKKDTGLFVALGISVEEDISCRTLHRLARPPRSTP